MFPGAIGIDFANELDAIFGGRFKNVERLIIDIRGNPGGGIGGLALMSYLVPDRLPIGYSKSRDMARGNVSPERLPVFDRVPRSKLALTIVGMQTSGRLVTRRASKLGFGYRLVIPIAAYISARGSQIEGKGVTPDISIPWSFEDAGAGIDTQLEGAVEALHKPTN